MDPFRFHLFVCTQQKPEGVSSCTASGASAVLNGLDREIPGSLRCGSIVITNHQVR